MKEDQCRLDYYRLQERDTPEVKLQENFVICTWKVRIPRFTSQVVQALKRVLGVAYGIKPKRYIFSVWEKNVSFMIEGKIATNL